MRLVVSQRRPLQHLVATTNRPLADDKRVRRGTIEHIPPFRQAIKDFLDDEALRLGAALSYYAVLSLSPLLLVVVAVAGWIGGRAAIAERLVNEMRNLMGESAAQVAQTVLSAPSTPAGGIVAVSIAALTLILGATGAFVQLQEALNIIWEVKATPRSGIWSFIRNRLLSFAMVLGIGFLLLVSLVFDAMLTLVNERFTQYAPSMGWLWEWAHLGVSVLIMGGLFALMFKLLPDARIAWRDVWFGAGITSLLMTLGKFGIGLYLGHSSVGSMYGAAGSLVVLLVWVYYASLIVLFGAELTQINATRRGRGSQSVFRSQES